MNNTFRLLCTNDFAGSWDPAPTSNGRLPGGRALRDEVDRLREETTALWIDAGDLVAGGALGVADRGATAWRAAATLGIDIAVPGNHEFDWGLARFKELVQTAGIMYLCANAKLDLPATRIVDTPAGTVGLIGATCPQMDNLCADFADVGLSPLNEVIVDSARTLRRDGADFVVAIVHDGAAGTDMSFLGDWYHAVDVVVGGHTLWRCMGRHGETAVCQPAAYGSEIGVVEFRRGRRPEVWGVAVEPGGRWNGPGVDQLARAREDVVTTATRSLTSVLNAPSTMLDTLAASLAAVSSADAALVSLWDCWVTQPIDDGVVSYLPAGTMTRADLLRYSPHAHEPIATLELTWPEFEQTQHELTIPFLPALGISAPTTRAETMRVALSRRQAAAVGAQLGQTACPVGSGSRAVTISDAWCAMFPAT